MRDVADHTVSGIIEKWSAAFHKLDAAALASLYAKNTFFYGSKPKLYRGNDGVAAYFNALPRWSSPVVHFTEVITPLISPDFINMAGPASVFVSESAMPLSGKLTW